MRIDADAIERDRARRRSGAARLPASQRRLPRRRVRDVLARQRRRRPRLRRSSRRADDLRRRHQGPGGDRGRARAPGGPCRSRRADVAGARGRDVHGGVGRDRIGPLARGRPQPGSGGGARGRRGHGPAACRRRRGGSPGAPSRRPCRATDAWSAPARPRGSSTACASCWRTPGSPAAGGSDPGHAAASDHRRPDRVPPVRRRALHRDRGHARAGLGCVIRLVEGFGDGRSAPSLSRALGCAQTEAEGNPQEIGSTVPGFVVTRSVRPAVLALMGQHRFSRYALVFSIIEKPSGVVLLGAQTRAEFPGRRGERLSRARDRDAWPRPRHDRHPALRPQACRAGTWPAAGSVCAESVNTPCRG